MITASKLNRRGGSLKDSMPVLWSYTANSVLAHPVRWAQFRKPKNELESFLHKSPQLYVPDVDREQRSADAPDSDIGATLWQYPFNK